MVDQHYFTAQPASADERREISVELADRELDVTTAPGVFSGERLDPGTSVLLPFVEPSEQGGDVLDLGCGWGPVTLALGLQQPGRTLWAVDVNERALDLLRRNASRYGIDVTAALPDDVPADLEFAEIWSNPPIRVGKEALHGLLLRWLPRLAVGGAAHLVVQKNLGADSLHRWLGSGVLPGTTTTRLTSSKGFRVLRVDRVEPAARPPV